ncbi:hypothetical protein A5746_12960 [Mycolicibacterium conceptionense]|uniref:hypothetical protein n=1 Tax=Mycolicibacterium conceptionense TaxID=451644 RepID=UPI0007ECA4C0|nr:hypothetical protein [Mycolicibacterium conceptionense]OBJ98350.1 hypothetical protein A5639_29485 [Mycolicibacterium conceptionense]OMB86010.1 hypothetical protein A5741_18120 [Mycolicibacterium conceptionense]OMC00005.1 hypothetical protein A5746_12960 [Mycolicibacterium conceptionense]
MALFQRKVPCPYCYNEIAPNALAVRCSGRAAPGKSRCTEMPDQARIQFFSDGTPVLPVIVGADKKQVLSRSEATCPDCGAVSAIRVCPDCHSRMPRSFDADSPLFGLVGVRGSGKTVMLAVLQKELYSTIARRFDASIDSPGGKTGLAGELEMFLRGMEDSSNGVLPTQTAAHSTGMTIPAVFEWRFAKKSLGGKLTRDLSTLFSFYDSAGEDLATEDRALGQHYLAATSGVILLLDPFGFPGNRERAMRSGVDPESLTTSPETVLRALTTVLQTAEKTKKNKKIKQPVAVVVSKIDAFFHDIPDDHPMRRPSSKMRYFDDLESLTIHDHIAAMIEQWGGDALLRMLDSNYEKYRLFGASALGAEPQYQSRKVSSRGVLPHRVGEPLLWLMADRGFLPKEG